MSCIESCQQSCSSCVAPLYKEVDNEHIVCCTLPWSKVQFRIIVCFFITAFVASILLGDIGKGCGIMAGALVATMVITKGVTWFKDCCKSDPAPPAAAAPAPAPAPAPVALPVAAAPAPAAAAPSITASAAAAAVAGAVAGAVAAMNPFGGPTAAPPPQAAARA